jgi:hypothetical protein
MKASTRNVNRKFSELQILYLAKFELYELCNNSDFRTYKIGAEISQVFYVFELPYFPAYKTRRLIRCTLIFSLEILEKIMMNVF